MLGSERTATAAGRARRKSQEQASDRSRLGKVGDLGEADRTKSEVIVEVDSTAVAVVEVARPRLR